MLWKRCQNASRQVNLHRPWDESEQKEELDVTLKGLRVPTLFYAWDTDGNRQTGILDLPVIFLQFEKVASQGRAQSSF
jgi:hypothetical protein